MMYSVSGVLVLPADLPQMKPDDVTVMVNAAKYSQTMVIAPDHRQQGTNALLLRPPDLITYSFGENSFYRHVQQANDKGAKVEIVELPSLARDVDYPEDLAFLNGALEEWTRPEEDYKHKKNSSYAEMIANGSVGSEN
jgi:2-phospho-L-lactate guanylyltransferase